MLRKRYSLVQDSFETTYWAATIYKLHYLMKPLPSTNLGASKQKTFTQITMYKINQGLKNDTNNLLLEFTSISFWLVRAGKLL